MHQEHITNDYIITAVAFDGKVRVLIADSTETCGYAAKIHNTSPLASAALGRTLTAGVLMSRLLKNDTDSLTIQIKGDGPLGSIIVTADSKSNVKGYVDKPYVDLPLRKDGKLDVAAGVGKGYLHVIKNLGLKEPYSGLVNLISGEIAEDMAYYFSLSEQVNSAVSLGVLINTDNTVAKAGGFIIQLLPGHDEKCISFLEEQLSSLPPMTRLLSEGNDCEAIMDRIFQGQDIKILTKAPCRYLCGCSRDKMERNLISLGKKELITLSEDDDSIELVCHFCNEKYIFTKDELKEIIARF